MKVYMKSVKCTVKCTYIGDCMQIYYCSLDLFNDMKFRYLRVTTKEELRTEIEKAPRYGWYGADNLNKMKEYLEDLE